MTAMSDYDDALKGKNLQPNDKRKALEQQHAFLTAESRHLTARVWLILTGFVGVALALASVASSSGVVGEGPVVPTLVGLVGILSFWSGYLIYDKESKIVDGIRDSIRELEKDLGYIASAEIVKAVKAASGAEKGVFIVVAASSYSALVLVGALAQWADYLR